MTLREKVLVGLMIAAVIIGAVSLMSGEPKSPAPVGDGSPSRPLTRMLAKLTAQFDKGTGLDSSRYTLDLAQSPWQETLFLDEGMLSTDARMSDAADALPANLSLVYSGYIETSRRRVAIINGIEYMIGDQLDQSSYRLYDITPQQVVIATPQQRIVAIPLAESWEVGPP